MAVVSDNFFSHIDDFFNYRNDIYEISPQTLKSNRVDLDLFKNFICSQNLQTIDGPAVRFIRLILPILILKAKRSPCSAKVKSREPCTSMMS